MKRIILALCLTTTAAFAQDAGLYDDIASPDASFVRVIVSVSNSPSPPSATI